MIAAFAFALALIAAPPQLAPSIVLERYASALANVREPKALIFNYTLAQVGETPLYQVHRMYRSGMQARDETVEMDGHPLSVPSVRIVNGSKPHYRIGDVAPLPKDYTFTFIKAILTGSHWSYVFKTEPASERDFAVDAVTIDGLTFLPSRLEFTSVQGTVQAKGSLVYAKVDAYWLIQEADVEAPITGERAAERIIWRNYAFPPALPPETFRS